LYRQLNQAAKTQSTQSDVFERSRVLSQLRNKKKQVNPLYQRFLLSGYRLMSHDDGIGGDEQSWAQLEQAVGSVLDAHEPHDAILFAATAEDIHSRIGLMSSDATTDREQASFEDRCLQAASSGAIVSTTAALTELAQEIAPIHASVIELLDGLQALPEDVKKSHGAFTLEIAIVMKRVEEQFVKAVKDARRSFIDNEDDSDAEHTACSGHTGKQASTANAERPARLVEQPEAQEVMTEQEKDAIVALQALGRDMRAKKQELGWQAITPAFSHLRVECGYGSENEEEDVNGTEIGDRARGEAWERDCCWFLGPIVPVYRG
jgi:hypothetical protein